MVQAQRQETSSLLLVHHHPFASGTLLQSPKPNVAYIHVPRNRDHLKEKGGGISGCCGDLRQNRSYPELRAYRPWRAMMISYRQNEYTTGHKPYSLLPTTIRKLSPDSHSEASRT